MPFYAPHRSVSAVAVLCALPLHAATLAVGPGKAFSRPCAAIAAAAAGDAIEIDAQGEYKGDVCTWSTDRLTLRGINGRPKIDAAGRSSQGKAIWVIRGSDTVVENLEFTGAAVPDKNGAGIRQDGRNLTVRRCYFHHNEDGILAGDSLDSRILIEYSEFAYNGAGDGYSHNLYINHVARFTLQFCYSHHSKVGHLVKTRAAENYILYNRLSDEAEGTGSYEINVPNGGETIIIGNVIEQGPQTSNSTIMTYRDEGPHPANPSTNLYVVNNTFANDRPGTATFISIPASDPTPAMICNNIFYGPGIITNQRGALLMGNVSTLDDIFVDAAKYDYHVRPGVPTVSASVDTANVLGPFTPRYQYVHPSRSEPRRPKDPLEAGAYEFGACSLYVAKDGNDRHLGRLPSDAFQHIRVGVAAAHPGDVVCVGDGDYKEDAAFFSSGTPDRWITLRPRIEVDVHTAQPRVRISPTPGANAFTLTGLNYIRIEGLEISGGLFGIVTSGQLSHHTVITNNLIHDTAASGIQLNNGDYRTITYNIVHDCAKTWKGNGSGISIYTPTAFDSAPGFHNVLAQNISYGNSNPPGGSDGEGIIFDDGKHSQSDKLAYSPATLIENNLVYFNGGAGIEVYYSSNVTVRNNTAYWNRQLPNQNTWRGDLSNQVSDDVTWVNNIAWANPSLSANNTALLDTPGTSGVIWLHNISYNGTPGQPSFNYPTKSLPAGNLLGVNPLLVNPPGYFHPQPGSPALGAGTSAYGFPAVDLAGSARLGALDIGAYVAEDR